MPSQAALPEAPEADSEIECPKCSHVFLTDTNLVHAGAAEEAEAPAKKGSRNDDDPPKKKKKGKKAAVAPAPGEPPKKKRRKLKKRKTNPMVLVGAIIGGLMVLGFIVGALIWFFNRKSASQEMMMYLPDECDEVTGVNLGHMQKYPEFYKSCESTFATTGFKKAADVFSKALGQETNDTVDYVVQGVGKSGGSPDGHPVEATVLRTKTPYDASLLSKIPGAKDYTQDGVKYYTIDNIAELGYPGLRVFAPTDRIVVFCRGDMPEKTFRAMLNGNKDNPDGTAFKRSGQLGKQVIRGTAWKFTIFNRSMPKMIQSNQQPTGQGQESDDDQMRKEIMDILSSAQGTGYKASVGSREVRGEWVIWYKDSEVASDVLKKWKDKEWIKDEEKDPPRYWKAVANRSGGGKTAPNVLRDGLGFRQTGETFIIRTAMETKLIQPSSLVTTFTNLQSNVGGGGTQDRVPVLGLDPVDLVQGQDPVDRGAGASWSRHDPRAYNAVVISNAPSEPWPPKAPSAPLAVLVSGGADSAILLAEATRAYPQVHPLYVRTGILWEAAELDHLARFLRAIHRPSLQPLHILEQPVTDLYGRHWSLTGIDVPAAATPDEDVFLPGRNVLLLAKSLLWCHLNAVPEIAMAPLAANPFPDATPEFFRDFGAVVDQAMSGRVRVIRPYAHLHKTDVLRLAAASGIPLEHTFSCIRPANGRHCGRCSKCYERQVGFRDAALKDPTDYAEATCSV